MVLLQHVPSWLPRELLDKLQLTYLGEDWTGDWGSFAVGRGADSRTAIGTLRLDAVTSFSMFVPHLIRAARSHSQRMLRGTRGGPLASSPRLSRATVSRQGSVRARVAARSPFFQLVRGELDGANGTVVARMRAATAVGSSDIGTWQHPDNVCSCVPAGSGSRLRNWCGNNTRSREAERDGDRRVDDRPGQITAIEGCRERGFETRFAAHRPDGGARLVGAFPRGRPCPCRRIMVRPAHESNTHDSGRPCRASHLVACTPPGPAEAGPRHTPAQAQPSWCLTSRCPRKWIGASRRNARAAGPHRASRVGQQQDINLPPAPPETPPRPSATTRPCCLRHHRTHRGQHLRHHCDHRVRARGRDHPRRRLPALIHTAGIADDVVGRVWACRVRDDVAGTHQ